MSLAVFTSPSTPERGARMDEWLGAGGSGWCHVRLPPIHPESFDVEWNDAAEGRLAPVRVLNRTSRARLITMQPPWGRLDRDAEGGIGSAHKVACTMYHVLALECFAARCHPCVAHARFAAVFEDDAVFVPGTSPGTAAGFPALAAAAAAAAFDAHGVNKLHLAVQKVKAEGRNGSPNACTRLLGTTSFAGGARLLRCPKFSDSHAYVIEHSQAVRVVTAYRLLLERDGRASGECVNPWYGDGCATDPGVLAAYFKQCDQLKGRRRSNGSCRGALLASAGDTWSLRHEKKQKYRVGLASTGTNVNVYPAIVRLRAAVSNETFLAEARRAGHALAGRGARSQ
mmetsp:Transcript_48705/g.156636  ORF Transcript_48705/g.156636 Transcript_48705/m.156636 type:complete len:341 (-) Transcript_48705:188-1210(-)